MVIKSLLYTPAQHVKEMDVHLSDCFRRERNADQLLLISRSEGDVFLRIMQYRIINWGNAKVSIPVCNFAHYMCSHCFDTSHESIVLWSFTLVDIFRRVNHLVTFTDLVKFFFSGFPNSDGIDVMWQQQKKDGKDMLNDIKIWQKQSLCLPRIDLERASVSTVVR